MSDLMSTYQYDVLAGSLQPTLRRLKSGGGGGRGGAGRSNRGASQRNSDGGHSGANKSDIVVAVLGSFLALCVIGCCLRKLRKSALVAATEEPSQRLSELSEESDTNSDPGKKAKHQKEVQKNVKTRASPSAADDTSYLGSATAIEPLAVPGLSIPTISVQNQTPSEVSTRLPSEPGSDSTSRTSLQTPSLRDNARPSQTEREQIKSAFPALAEERSPKPSPRPSPRDYNPCRASPRGSKQSKEQVSRQEMDPMSLGDQRSLKPSPRPSPRDSQQSNPSRLSVAQGASPRPSSQGPSPRVSSRGSKPSNSPRPSVGASPRPSPRGSKQSNPSASVRASRGSQSNRLEIPSHPDTLV